RQVKPGQVRTLKVVVDWADEPSPGHSPIGWQRGKQAHQTARRRRSERCRVAEIRLSQVGASQVDVVGASRTEVGMCQVGSAEVRAGYVRPAQIGMCQVGTAEGHTAEVRPAERGALQVGAYKN